MINYVADTGPLAVSLCASDAFNGYKSGIVAACCTTINHAVQIVGVDTIQGFWIVRNSWGTGFGDQGTIKLKTVRDLPSRLLAHHVFLCLPLPLSVSSSWLMLAFILCPINVQIFPSISSFVLVFLHLGCKHLRGEHLRRLLCEYGFLGYRKTLCKTRRSALCTHCLLGTDHGLIRVLDNLSRTNLRLLV